MAWVVEFAEEFEDEFDALPESVQDEIYARAKLLEQFGPQLGRPTVDTLKDSKHSNLKELRFNVEGGVWRTAFAFDPDRKAMLLVAGDKAGEDQAKFYRDLIQKADDRFDAHLARIARKKAEEAKAKAGQHRAKRKRR